MNSLQKQKQDLTKELQKVNKQIETEREKFAKTEALKSLGNYFKLSKENSAIFLKVIKANENILTTVMLRIGKNRSVIDRAYGVEYSVLQNYKNISSKEFDSALKGLTEIPNVEFENVSISPEGIKPIDNAT